MIKRPWLLPDVSSGLGRLMTEALLERDDRVDGYSNRKCNPLWA
jgi:hypothetical protein